jgi:peptidoglycan/xylan/chitin deacetylase (PgdA/CDA1 family)
MSGAVSRRHKCNYAQRGEISRMSPACRLLKQIINVALCGFYYVGGLKVINALAVRFRVTKRQDKVVFPFVRRAEARDFQILVYHRINDDADAFFPGTPVHVFAQQMEYLAGNYSILSIEEAVSRSVAAEIPANAVVVTFDDGYGDNYLNAFPILRRWRIPAMIFLATDAIGSGKYLWHDEVFAAFRNTRVDVLEGLFEGERVVRSLRTLGDKLAAQREVLKRLKYIDGDERRTHVGRLREKLGIAECTDNRGLMLTWDEVREMSQYGISFGSHTVSHPILSTINEERVRFEIVESKRQVEKEINMPVRVFAYPNGTQRDFTERTKELLREAGYCCALTTISGTNGRERDLFELRRTSPWDSEIGRFGLRLAYCKLCA